MTLIAIGLLVSPFVAGWVGVLVTRSTDRHMFLAWILGVAVFVFATWFGGRADERPIEGLIAGVGTIACAYAIWRLRSANKAHAERHH